MSRIQTSAQTVLNSCINLLAVYPKTEYEISKKVDVYLAKPSFDDLSQEEKAQVKVIVLERLINAGIINDTEYFESFLRGNNSSSKPDGTLLIIKKMRQKGIPSEILEGKFVEMEEFDKINTVKLLKKKYGVSSISKDLPRAQQQKMAAYLASRGFKYVTVAELKKL